MSNLPVAGGADQEEILRLFNQFLQANGNNLDITKLNIELKISKKDEMQATTLEERENTMLESVPIYPSEETQVDCECHIVRDLSKGQTISHQSKPMEEGPFGLSETTPPSQEINKTVSFPFTDQGPIKLSDKMTSLSGALSPIPFDRTDTQEEATDLSNRKDLKHQTVTSCRSKTDHDQNDLFDCLSEGANPQGGQKETMLNTSIAPLATEHKSRNSLASQGLDSKLLKQADSFENLFLKPKMVSTKMEELYLKELENLTDNYETAVIKPLAHRSILKPSFSQRKTLPKLKLEGLTSSAKNLKEYIIWREGINHKRGEISPTFKNIFGEEVKDMVKLSSVMDAMPKHKSASPNFINKEGPGSPLIDIEDDDTLRKHFGEMSLLNEEDDSLPPTAGENLKDLGNKQQLPKTHESPKDKVTPIMRDDKFLITGMEGERDEQDYKKLTKISHLMQNSMEDDGSDLLGLLEAAKTNEEFWMKGKSRHSERKEGDTVVKIVYKDLEGKTPDGQKGKLGKFFTGEGGEGGNQESISCKERMLAELFDDLKKKANFDAEALKTLEILKKEAYEAVTKASNYERQLKHVENFTNSYSQKSVSKCDMNNTTAFKSMMNMLEDLYENEDVLNSTKVYHNFKDSNLHFCLMFASPLVIFRESLGTLKLQTIPWEIEYNEDLIRIKRTLKNVGCDIKFLSAKASTSTFVDVMKRNPMILHFCGHGVDNTRGAKAVRSMEENIDNYYLLFEDHLGRGELITSDLLTTMISSAYKVITNNQGQKQPRVRVRGQLSFRSHCAGLSDCRSQPCGLRV